MSVFGSLFTAVSALSAQSQALGMISNNIANVSTVGFKRTDAAFSSLVTTSSRTTLYSPGSVTAIQTPRVNQQGILQQSSSATDIAISGNGFYVVKKSATDPLSESLYTRAGSFSENSSGVLENSGGFALFGWPLGPNGSLPSSQADISSLVPVNVSFLGGLTQPTSTANLAVNLNSAQATSVYPVPSGFTPDFTRDIRVFDSLGAGHNLTVNFKKHESPTAIATGVVDLSSVSGPLVGQTIGGHTFALNEKIDVSVTGAVPATKTINIGAATDLQQVIASINTIQDVNGNSLVFSNIDSNGHMVIKARNIAPATTITLANNTGTPLGGFGLVAGASAPPIVPALLAGTATTPNTEGWWDVQFKTPTGAIVNEGSINFNGSGQLNTALSTSGQSLVALNNIDWANGSAKQAINFDIAGFTQFSGEYNVVASNQNGAELGLRTGISIDSDGFVTAQFSNGQSSKIFKLALATFANTNGLNELTGNVFRQSDQSGDYNLREAGKGSAGTIAGGALESSNVDLADEFSKMIVTQRAYSANTKVISTADQMTQELLQLR
jgi:flagellar hook protein FlgE